ncbi:MAG: amino acid adenylation domain-containing protein [Cohaesibacter sp.]|nr:amino acid adenylation domain-containing protein [Cohaesibacter sp.]
MTDQTLVETETITSLFTQQARSKPKSVAVSASGQSLSYGELDHKASRIALALYARGITKGSIIAVSMLRTPDFVVALLGILKAGAAYLPINPAWPKERVITVLDIAQTPIIIVDSTTKEDLAPNSLILDFEEILKESERASVPLPAINLSPEDLAYVNFTSGSSGVPKGVLIPHRGVISLLSNQIYAPLSPSIVTLQHFAPSFDPMTFEIWAPLLHGGRCALFSSAVPTIGRLTAEIIEQGVNTVILTASLFNMVVDDAPKMLQALDTLLVGGEALSPTHVLKASTLAPKLSIINAYGPTEITFIATYFPICEMPEDALTVPLGYPLAHRGIHLLDKDLRPVSDGGIGEICISGPGLALGYLREPQKTDKAFVITDAIDGNPKRIYRTGDMGSISKDGLIEFHGRTDTQVQLNGLRIELEEIDRALTSHPKIKQAATSLCGKDLGLELCAGIVPVDAMPNDLPEFLTQSLPAYMVPRKFKQLNNLPLNAHGKIDRKKIEQIFLIQKQSACL